MHTWQKCGVQMRPLTVSQRFPLASVHSASAAAACAADVDGRPAAPSRRRRWSMSCVPARRTAACGATKGSRRARRKRGVVVCTWASNARREIRPPCASVWFSALHRAANSRGKLPFGACLRRLVLYIVRYYGRSAVARPTAGRRGGLPTLYFSFSRRSRRPKRLAGHRDGRWRFRRDAVL